MTQKKNDTIGKPNTNQCSSPLNGATDTLSANPAAPSLLSCPGGAAAEVLLPADGAGASPRARAAHPHTAAELPRSSGDENES